MNTEEAERLLDKYIAGKASPQERAILERWFIRSSTGRLPEISEILEEQKRSKSLLMKEIGAKSKVININFLKVAASIVFIMVCSYFVFRTISRTKSGVEFVKNSRDISAVPGGVTLSGSNGNIVKLSALKTGLRIDRSKMRYDDGSQIDGFSDNDPKENMLTLKVASGQTFQVTLPDGSRVALNAGSSLKFPSSFSGLEKRAVELSGEGYFEVAKSKTQTFVVSSAHQRVTVLGTHFNVNAYADEPTSRTSLLEGSVRVNGRNNSSTTVIRPGQQAILTENRIKVDTVDKDEVLAWKNGMFQFYETPLEIVMLQIARWYGVTIIYKNAKVRSQTFSGSVSRYDKVSDLLTGIALTGVVHFRIDGRTIIVE